MMRPTSGLTRRCAPLVGALALLICPWVGESAAHAQAVETAEGGAGLAAYTAGRFAEAAVQFYDEAENAEDAGTALRAEYFLTRSLTKLGMHHSALFYDRLMLERGPTNPYYWRALENVLEVMERSGDRLFGAELLDLYQDAEAIQKLPPAAQDRLNLAIGIRNHYQRKLDDAAQALDAVTEGSPSALRAKYFRALQAAQSPTDVEGQARAGTALEGLMAKLDAPKSADDKALAELVTLALARVYYGQGRFEEAAALYEKVPSYSRGWKDALFEGAYASFMNGEPGRALGKLKTLHAPFAAGQFVPESLLLRGTIYFQQCLYADTDEALQRLTDEYEPVAKQLKLVLDKKLDLPSSAALLVEGEREGIRLADKVRNELLSDDQIHMRRSVVASLDAELAALKAQTQLGGSPLGKTLTEHVEKQRAVAWASIGASVQSTLKRLSRTLDDIDEQSGLLSLERKNSEEEQLKEGHDAQGTLAAQSLSRPRMPGRGHDYWKFDDEYWPDEVGHYQLTIKNACPASAEQNAE